MESISETIKSNSNASVNFDGVENLKLIKDTKVKNNLIYLIRDMRDVFVENKMQDSMVYGFFLDCMNGQILISLDQKPDHFVNKVSHFYIDSRVGFRGIRRVHSIIKSIEQELLYIVPQYKSLSISDIVKPSLSPSNIILKDKLEENPELTMTIMSIERGLDPNYIGYYVVKSNEKPYKENFFYVGSNDILPIGGKN